MTEQFSIQQIYLKDLSFQVPSGATIFVDQWAPQLKADVKVSHSTLPGGLVEVILTIAVVATNNGSTAFMVEVFQAGIFQIAGFEGDDLDRMLRAKCPAILLPYARETVDTVLMKGRFPALILDPIDFDGNWLAGKR